MTTEGEEVHIKVGEQEFGGWEAGSRAVREAKSEGQLRRVFSLPAAGAFNRGACDTSLWEQLGGCTIQTVSRKCYWSQGQSRPRSPITPGSSSDPQWANYRAN